MDSAKAGSPSSDGRSRPHFRPLRGSAPLSVGRFGSQVNLSGYVPQLQYAFGSPYSEPNAVAASLGGAGALESAVDRGAPDAEQLRQVLDRTCYPGALAVQVGAVAAAGAGEGAAQGLHAAVPASLDQGRRA